MTVRTFDAVLSLNTSSKSASLEPATDPEFLITEIFSAFSRILEEICEFIKGSNNQSFFRAVIEL